MDPRIADYIRANRKKFTREAITQQLVDAGHDRAEVESTWAALAAPDPDAVAGEGFWGRFALILVGVNIAVFLLVALLTNMLVTIGQGGVILPVILGVALAVGALIAWGIVAATGPARMSPTTATVIGVAVPLLFALIIGGSCYALVGAMGGPPQPVFAAVIQAQLGPPLDVTETIDGTCQPYGSDPADGFAIYGFVEGPQGPGLDINVSANPGPTGGSLVASVFISSFVVDDVGERQLGWGHDMPTGGTTDMSLDGMNGTVSFTGLPPMQVDPESTADESLSGEISWTCER